MASISGVHINTYYNIFRGIPVAGQTAEKVCKALGFEVEFEPSRP